VKNTKHRNRLLASAAILLLGLAGTQIYGYVRYGFFPFNPIFLIIGLPSRVFLQRTVTGHSDSIYSIAITPDGQTLASGSFDNTIKLWKLALDRKFAR
jgi:WD40 repeat protein